MIVGFFLIVFHIRFNLKVDFHFTRDEKKMYVFL